jgi:hypothetical protein
MQLDRMRILIIPTISARQRKLRWSQGLAERPSDGLSRKSNSMMKPIPTIRRSCRLLLLLATIFIADESIAQQHPYPARFTSTPVQLQSRSAIPPTRMHGTSGQPIQRTFGDVPAHGVHAPQHAGFIPATPGPAQSWVQYAAAMFPQADAVQAPAPPVDSNTALALNQTR